MTRAILTSRSTPAPNAGLDTAVHLSACPPGSTAAAWLLAGGLRSTDSPRLIASMLVYAAGLIGMLGASAAYHLTRPAGPRNCCAAPTTR